ncbi:hypothetical protein J31TS4_29970 [Paenibacillus sp. J31TS4]|uniref:LTA synthase family protein n=1 Tax=Paenibacillus sp. J31TS4 TaxID=2807195 RepID=UPI001B1FC6BC|nr:LTA synthase family protein [Paenibacillus sp. J31TS4]GIP39717.1 hypothetical protein J31TS4_29970 [Paenibacillus sp. J31TS4]
MVRRTKAAAWGSSPFVLFTLLLWMKMLLLRYFLFGTIGWRGAAVDLGSVIVLTGLVELVTPIRAKRAVYWSLNGLLSVVFLAAAVYFRHFGSVVIYTSLFEVKQLAQVSSSVKTTLRPEHILFFADFAIGWILVNYLKKQGKSRYGVLQISRLAAAVLLLVGAASSMKLVRAEGQIANELVRAEKLGFLNYETAVLLNGKKEEESRLTSTEQAHRIAQRLQAHYGYGQPTGPVEHPAYFASQEGKNVLVLQLEAFQAFPLHLKVGGQEVTPNLNRLMQESFTFSRIFQQIGQGNTSDAEFLANTSIYPTGTIAMSTGYGNRELPSLPKLLKERGYESLTFHVNAVKFWDRDKLYSAIGFDRYYDKPAFTNDRFNEFGASDEELFRVGLERLTEQQQSGKPFYAQMVTASSHHPFKIPKEKETLALPEKLSGTEIGNYLQAVHYTDSALGQLIEGMKANGLWDNTMLVLYGDHFGLQLEGDDVELLKQELGIPYHPLVSRFNIPLIIHAPGASQGTAYARVGGQVDIAPTMANLLGIALPDEDMLPFGRDLLNSKRNVVGMRYYLPTGSFFNNEILFIPGAGFEDGKAISLHTLEPVEEFSAYRQDYDYILKLMKLSDEYVKVLPKRDAAGQQKASSGTAAAN